jgi:twitching motility protein PilJ
MQVLREISAQTAESSSATTNSIGKLAQLSAQLRQSVSGFRLPGVDHAAALAQMTQQKAPSVRTDKQAPAAPSSPQASAQAGGARKVGRLSA